MSVPPDPVVPPIAYDLPTVDDVAALLRARTQDDNDQEIGTFDDTTRPTGSEVDRIIKQAATVVYNSTGNLVALSCENADQIREGAKYLISLLACCLVELSYFPEQVRSDRSAFQQYYDIFTNEVTGMPALVQAVNECTSGEVEPGGDAEGSTRAAWEFMTDAGGLVGWMTKW